MMCASQSITHMQMFNVPCDHCSMQVLTHYRKAEGADAVLKVMQVSPPIPVSFVYPIDYVNIAGTIFEEAKQKMYDKFL